MRGRVNNTLFLKIKIWIHLTSDGQRGPNVSPFPGRSAFIRRTALINAAAKLLVTTIVVYERRPGRRPYVLAPSRTPYVHAASSSRLVARRGLLINGEWQNKTGTETPVGKGDIRSSVVFSKLLDESDRWIWFSYICYCYPSWQFSILFHWF